MKWLLLFSVMLCNVLQAETTEALPTQLQFRQALTSPAAQYSQALLSEAYRRLNIDARFIDIPFGRSLLESNKGSLDGELARVLDVTKHYPNLVAVPYVLFDTNVFLYINQQRCRDCTLDNVPSLAYVRGSLVLEEILRKLPPSRQVISSGSIESTKNLFLTGKVDAAIFAAYQLNAQSHFKISEQFILSLPDYHLLHRDHSALLQPLANMLFQLEREGYTEGLRLHFGIAAPRRQLQAGQQPFANY